MVTELTTTCTNYWLERLNRNLTFGRTVKIISMISIIGFNIFFLM